MPGLSNYPPGVTGNEPQIAGGPDAPGFILRCLGCGEDFDALQPAVDHIMAGMSGEHDCDEETTWQILPDEMSDTDDQWDCHTNEKD